MNKQTIVIMILALVALSACETRVINEPASDTSGLSVQGSANFEAAPDIAKVRFRIETQSQTAQDAQSRNRDVGSAVHQALLAAGVKESEIETTDYHIEKVQEWDQTSQKMVEKGYRASNAFRVTTKELQKVGPIIDTGIQSGATNVESISFELSDAKQKDVKTEALHRAAQNAHEKALALAGGAEVQLGKVKSVSEQNYMVLPYDRYLTEQMKVGGSEQSPTVISPGMVEVNAMVNVVYEVR